MQSMLELTQYYMCMSPSIHGNTHPIYIYFHREILYYLVSIKKSLNESTKNFRRTVPIKLDSDVSDDQDL